MTGEYKYPNIQLILICSHPTLVVDDLKWVCVWLILWCCQNLNYIKHHSVEWYDDWWIGKDSGGSSFSLIDMLSWHFSGGTEEKPRRISKDRQSWLWLKLSTSLIQAQGIITAPICLVWSVLKGFSYYHLFCMLFFYCCPVLCPRLLMGMLYPTRGQIYVLFIRK